MVDSVDPALMKEDKRSEFIAKFKEFLHEAYKTEMVIAASEDKSVAVDFVMIDKFNPKLSELLLQEPERFFEISEEAAGQVDLPKQVKLRFFNLPEGTNIRDLRSKHIDKFLSIEGTVRKASEIRPEITASVWRCLDCEERMTVPVKGNFIAKPFKCNCGSRNFEQVDKEMIDTRWVVVEEPFELTEGERPSQVTVLLKEDLVSPDGRRLTDPGNRLKITGVLRDVPKGKAWSTKLDFYMDGNHVDPVEIGWQQLNITDKDIEEIKKLAKRPDIYDLFVDSLAPSLYGMREIKESIILQLFGGVPLALKDGTHFRGDIHLLLIGDPSAGKSQLLKLVPEIVPRGRYVSGKGVTGAGLCMSYDTMIPMAHGEIRQIGELVESELSKRKEEMKDGFITSPKNLEINTMDMNDYKLKKKKVSKCFKLKPKRPLLKLKLRSGREIKLTQENPLLVIDNGEIVWKGANQMKVGEFVGTARKIPINQFPQTMDSDFSRMLGMIAGDGDVGQREIRFHNSNEYYLNEFMNLSSNLGYNPRKYYQNNRVPCIRIASKELCDKVDEMGIARRVKCDKIVIPGNILRSDKPLIEFLSGIFNCDGGVVNKGNGTHIEYSTTSEKFARQLQTSLLRFSILSKLRKRMPSKKGYGGKKLKYSVIIRGTENLIRFDEKIGFTGTKNEKMKRFLAKELKTNTNIDIIPNIGKRLREVRKELGIPIKNDKDLYYLRQYEYGNRDFSRDKLLEFIDKLESYKKHPYFDYLKKVANSDIFWDRIEKIEEVKEDWVYDLTVEDEHNFVANDFIVHNTATVTKDEQFMGGWVLEAGALVLANKGLLSIDEFEKMSAEDQVAMHEALEQGSISIAKASIVATLPAKTSVLAGGNPKFSRFDPYVPIAKQITIPDTLLSRFDLKFALRDIPNAEQDKNIVDHVVSVREDENYEGAIPKLERRFIRKYIAYARDVCKPTLTSEASRLLKTFYIKTRKKGEDASAAIPITLRQFEAMIRLSEASAKMQLSEKVRKSDAQRAIKLVRFSLRQLGFDPETGQIDVDRSEGGTSSSERGKIRVLLDIINNLSAKKKEIPINEIREAARKESVEDVDDIIEKLKREGMLFEPTPGFIQKV
jgi:replicative DNA helicase Mcm